MVFKSLRKIFSFVSLRGGLVEIHHSFEALTRLAISENKRVFFQLIVQTLPASQLSAEPHPNPLLTTFVETIQETTKKR